jgi:hypothetical protein
MRHHVLAGAAALALLSGTGAAEAGPPTYRMELLGTYAAGGELGEGAAEIAAFAPFVNRLFVVNGERDGIDVLDIRQPSNPQFIGRIDVSRFGSSNSVAVNLSGIVAVAVEAPVVTDPGSVLFYRSWGTIAADAEPIGSVQVGALPDMLTFDGSGTTLLVANEGEPDGGIDPQGSISVVDLRRGAARATVRTAGFEAFNADKAALKALGVRFPAAEPTTVAQDVEPEYITVSRDGRTAWVTLQENNALAVLDVRAATVTDILPLGTKDHGIAGNGLDASDRDGRINIATWPVRGMYMPDAIASFTVRGQTYLITANEGDDRGENRRVSTLTLDAGAFPDGAVLKQADNLGRLNVSSVDGNTGPGGSFTQLFSYGARSFTIWSADGTKVYDSGDTLEQLTAAALPADFNSDNEENGTLEDRSDNKGPEPEGVAVGSIGSRTYAFVGLERIGGVMSFDVTDPRAPQFVQYVNNRDFSATDPALAGDLGPEGVLFIPRAFAPKREPLLVVANEISGTTSIYALRRGDACSPLDPRC